MILAIDTSTDIASLALYLKDKVVKETSWYCQKNHTVELLPHLYILLKSATLTVDAIQAVTVAIGPGSYNGVRVGMSTAKGLALGLGIPIFGISTLEATAYGYANHQLPICPVFNVGRGQIATALYQVMCRGLKAIRGEHLTTIEELITNTRERTIFCGEYIPDIASQLLEKLGQKAVIARDSDRQNRANLLAKLGYHRLEDSQQDNLATLHPIYLRPPAITKPKKMLARLKTTT